MNDILTAKEVAEELRCSRAQVYRLLNGTVKDVPKLPYISLGRKRVVRRSALEDWKRLNEGCILSIDADSDCRSPLELGVQWANGIRLAT